MRKFIYTFAFMALMAVIPASAQDFRFGVKGGLNNTKLSLDIDELKSSSRFGWFIGPTMKVDFPVLFGIDVSALYDQRKMEIDETTVTQKSIEIPVNARLKFDLAAGTGLFFALGPQIGFNVGDDEFNWKDKNDYENTFQMKKSNFSFNFGAGVKLIDRLEVGFTYNVALGKTGDLENVSVKTIKDDPKSKSWNLSASFYF
jgi:hypothetical protein